MQKEIGIVGGSLAGLAAANAYHRLGYNVTVFEKSPVPMNTRGSSLGFVDVKLWEYLRNAPMIRLGARANRSQGAYYYGDLWKFLFDGLPVGTVNFDHTVTSLGEDNMHPTIDGKVYDVVVIADGGFSSLRTYVNGDAQPEYSGHVIYRIKLALEHFPDFSVEGAHNAGQNGQYFTMALNVVQNDGQRWIMGGLAVGLPESEVKRPEAGVNRQDNFVTPFPDWFLPFVRKTFKRQGGGQILKWFELAATKGKISSQPLFEFKADKVTSGRIILIGDAAHMASPGTAAGAHTGILDALGIFEAFSENPNDIDIAIQKYDVDGRQRAKSLYLRSKEVSRQYAYNKANDERF